ncbi:MAG: ribonuclease HII [Candidatus Liptonbacteria bacterium]
MRYTIGIDEVGRGPLAGPVVVAALKISNKFKYSKKQLGILKDSKRLSHTRRKKWVEYLKTNPHIEYTIGRAYPVTIDRINIARAANRAAHSAFVRLCAMRANKSTKNGREIIKINKLSKLHKIFLDGGLYIKNKENSQKIGAKTIIRGDEKIKAIALASIIAKENRDQLMVRLAKKYPGYGFEIHKGYGTRLHYRRIKKLGPSIVHRLTFLS